MSYRTQQSPGLHSRWSAALREPLLHFVLLGGLIFGVDALLVDKKDDPRAIVYSQEADDDARRVFREARGRDPNPDELAALRRAWLDNEVLYREGLALQVDRGDAAIRERVIFKALSVVNTSVALPPFDDERLRAWFNMNRAKYEEPARFDFQEAVRSGDVSEMMVRAFVAELNDGVPGDADARLRVFKGRPRTNLVHSYGPGFAEALEAAVPGQWQALPTSSGWRAIQLETIALPEPASFERLRGVVLQDWTDATLAEQRSAAVRALSTKYRVKMDLAAK